MYQQSLQQIAMTHAQNFPPQPTPIKEESALDINLNQLDDQVSRFYNGMNELDRLAERLMSDQKNPEPAPNGVKPAPSSDHIGKLRESINTFDHLNNRLCATIAYLQRII